MTWSSVASAGPKGAPAPPASAKADDGGPSPEARAANAKALELSKAGNYAEALEQFQRAYDLSPSYVILYNIGRMARLTQDFARGLRAFQQYLNEGGIEIDAARRSEVEQDVASLTSLVCWTSIRAESGARVSVDGRDLGVAPIDQKIPVNPGARTFRAEKGGAVVTKDVSAKAGETLQVVLEAQKEGPVVGPKPTSSGFRFPTGVVVASWVATGAFTATAVATGVSAIATSSSLKSDVYVGPAHAPKPDSDIAKKQGRVRALATASNAFVAASIVVGTAALTFTIVDAALAPNQDRTKPKPAPKPASVDLEVGAGSIFVTGSF